MNGRGRIVGMPRRAIIYTRISADREDKRDGVESQAAKCKAKAKALGWDVVNVYEDNDISAMSEKARPAYRAVLEDLREGRADALVVWHTDRLYRRLRDLEEIITLLEARDVAIATVESGDLDLSTATGRRNARLLGSVAQGEVEQTRERVRAQKEYAAAAGRYRGGPRPFGYEKDGLEVREVEAAALLQAAEHVASGGSLRSAAQKMASAGIETAGRRSRQATWTHNGGADLKGDGAPMNPTALRRLLLRPRNAGFVEYTVTDRDSRTPTRQLVPAQWPAIIPEPLWRTVKAILDDPSRRTNPHSHGRRNLLSGLATCGVCGMKLHATTQKGGRRTYACPERHVTRDLENVDGLVLGVVAEYLRRHLPRILASDGSAEAARLTQSREEADRARTELNALAEQGGAGLLTVEQVVRMSAGLRTRLAAAEEAITSAAREVQFSELADAPDPGDAFLALPRDRQTSVIAAVVSVRVLTMPRGRPKGWTSGAPYFDPATVEISPRS